MSTVIEQSDKCLGAQLTNNLVEFDHFSNLFIAPSAQNQAMQNKTSPSPLLCGKFLGKLGLQQQTVSVINFTNTFHSRNQKINFERQL